MEVSALRYTGGMGLHGRSPLLRLQSDERLIALVRRGNSTAFEVLVARYQSRLLAFCRHLLGSREDAEDVLQEALAAAFNAILADDRPINVRPWLYRIARNRCLNHLRRIQAVGVDSMDVHLAEHGTSTADKVHRLEEFRMLVGDIQDLPETQKTALVLREMDALSYEQIAEAMETTVPSVKSLLVRARVSLAEAAEARMLTCDEVRMELAETAEGLRKKTSPVVRRHLRSCERCSVFQVQLKETSKALTAVLPIGPLVLLKQLFFAHLGHSAGSAAGSSATGASAAGASAAGQAAAVGSTAAAGSAAVTSAGSVISFGVGTIATKAAAGLAAAALVTAGAVDFSQRPRPRHSTAAAGAGFTSAAPVLPARGTVYHSTAGLTQVGYTTSATHVGHKHRHATKPATDKQTTTKAATTPTTATVPAHTKLDAKAGKVKGAKKAVPPGRTQSQTQTTVLSPTGSSGTTTSDPSAYDQSSGSGSTSSTSPSSTSTTGSSSGGSGTTTTGGGTGTTETGTSGSGSSSSGSTTSPSGSGSEGSAPGTLANPSTGGAGAGPAASLGIPPQ
jgi:RNA polymerase sigma factor (sigma-70 family)